MFYAFHCAQAYYLFRCVLTSCIQGPLLEKLIVLSGARGEIDSHNKMSKMIVNLSHELKTPINVIKGARFHKTPESNATESKRLRVMVQRHMELDHNPPVN